MTQEKFKDLIEHPLKHAIENPEVGAFRQYSSAKRVFLRALIGRTLRLTLQYPEYAKEYLESLPKAVNENIPTISNE